VNDEAELKLSQLYRQGAQELPSAELDRRVLQLARTECDGQAKPARRWPLRLPVSAAAGLLLAFGLVRLLLQEMPQDPGQRDAAPGGEGMLAPSLRAPAMREPLAESEALAPRQSETKAMGRAQAKQPAPSAAPSSSPVREQRQSTELSGQTKPQALPFKASPDPLASQADGLANAEPLLDRAALLARIQELLLQGQDDQAKRLLLEWQERYPEQPIPPEIESRLLP
jgi:hypothetical protein